MALTKKGKIALVVCLVGAAAIAAVLLGVLLTQLPPDGLNPNGPPPPKGGIVMSAKGEFLVAEMNTSNGQPWIFARSYDGNAWEGVPNLNYKLPEIVCTDDLVCEIKVANYTIRSFDVPQQLKDVSNSPMHLAARLYMQGAFGANKDDLEAVVKLYGTNFAQWVEDQMQLTPTLTRSYYRARANSRPPLYGAPDPVTTPCDIGSRWSRFAFDNRDQLQRKAVTVQLNGANSRFTVVVDNLVRTEVDSFLGQPYPGTGNSFPMTMTICAVDEVVGGVVKFSTNLGNCDSTNVEWTNPPVENPNPNALHTIPENQVQLVPVVGARPGSFVMKWRGVACNSIIDAGNNSYIRVGDTTLRFDQRMRWSTNTLEQPMETALTNQCPIIPSNVVNRDMCVRHASCGSLTTFKSALFYLNEDMLRAWYTQSGRYVYYVTNLRLEEPYDISPCNSGTSRWQRIGSSCPSPTSMDQTTTRDTIANALSSSSDFNPFVRDIYLSGANCVANPETIGAQIQAGGECFQHVHPDLYNVRDFTRWVEIHDGNQQAQANGRPNPIAKHAENGAVYLPFPANHPMQRFYDRQALIPLVGRYGDQIDFTNLNINLQSEEIAIMVGAIRNVTDAGTVACGSPGETETVSELGCHYLVQTLQYWEAGYSLESPVGYAEDYKLVVENVHLKAQDQLRQKVAWSISNFVVTSSAGDSDAFAHPEGWLSYYDIFIRHAFGNYRDILHEVSYHPIMGLYLSYVFNQAYAVNNNYPDENYAREIMQLFSVGLWRLNDDGTQKLDAYGLPQETYDNDDIMDFARLWTGFSRPFGRNNVANNDQYKNFVDPMTLKASFHDRFPKAKLDEGFLGDTYPLCDDFPSQMFMRKGARFEFTGEASIEGAILDIGDPNTIDRRGRFTPTQDSALYRALCAPSQSGACTFPLIVVLPDDLPCTGPQECNGQRLLTVKINDPVLKVSKYYSYIAPPCVRLTLFNTGKSMQSSPGRKQCGNPGHAVGAPVCCQASDLTRAASNFGPECKFANEVMDYATAQQRCADQGLVICGPDTITTQWDNTCAANQFMWTNTDCKVQLQVYRTGRVGIVDTNAPSLQQLLRLNSNNFFRVRWANKTVPLAKNGACPQPYCTVQPTPEGDSCLCDFTVADSAVYRQLSDLSSIPKDDAVDTIAEDLHIGAPDPRILSGYSKCDKGECTGLSNVIVWLHSNDNGGLSQRTIFELPPHRTGGRQRFLLNRESIVSIGTAFSFRNPPNFIPLLGDISDAGYLDHFSEQVWVRKIEHEVDALLEHLFEHDNTAIFVSYRLIQHMVTSNPSPRYVNKVVDAFRSGSYGGKTFSGRYGDLAATVYAIMVDHEARSPLVEADPSFGMLRDPLMQVYHVMRALEYKSPTNRETFLIDLDSKGGVMPFSSPSVFGFFLPEYRPFGVIGQRGLVGPQVQIATTPNLMGLLNGLNSLIEHGLTNCDDGFGVINANGGRRCDDEDLIRQTADGTLTWSMDSNAKLDDILDEISLLMTAGRMNPKTRQLLFNEYVKVAGKQTYDEEGVKHILKLLVAAPEFKTNTYSRVVEEVRKPSKKLVPSQGRPFKALVVLFHAGGADSFNQIVPVSGCPNKDLFAEYQSVRQGAAIEQSKLLPISVPAGTQPCDNFGMHPAMTNLHQLYQDGQALFTANVGVLIEPVSQQDVIQGKARLPPSVGAHNIMTRSAQNLYAQSVGANGILGRLTDALFDVQPPYPSGLFSMDGNQKAVQGDTPAQFITGQNGVVRLKQLQDLKEGLDVLSAFKSDSVFAESLGDLLYTSLNSTETLGQLLSNTDTTATFNLKGYTDVQMKQIAKLIKVLPSAGYERLIFFTTAIGFDTHGTFALEDSLGPVDGALGSFVEEMKVQGMWNNVVVMSVSEFGRTMTSNGQGTDHGWGGNNWIAGGSVKGGRILGQYPTVLSDESELSLGRGRLIPTTPFEALWNGIGEWLGLTPALIKEVLPNLPNFPAEKLFKQADLFNN